MKKEIDECLEKLAKLNNMTKQPDGTYKGQYGTTFYKTSFGFVTYKGLSTQKQKTVLWA